MWLCGLLTGCGVAAMICATSAHADPGPTFQQECETFYGNPDGSWCTWTNPANGKKYLVGSDDYYQQGHPLWGSEHW